MGIWSRRVGEIFLDWVKPPPGLRWIDVGCGNGAFTELIIERYAPAGVQGIDPSEAQIAYARTRPAGRVAEFRQGDAMALPFADASFDAAAMALVIFFVPEPATGVAEMARVVRPGGLVAAYAWDMFGGGFPLEPVFAELRAMGKTPMGPPSPEASRIDNLRALWTGAGLKDVETREIKVQRTFADFDEFWSINLLGPTFRPLFAQMSSAEGERLKTKVRARLPADSLGRITYGARANAVKGRVAG
jgi:ubiquinone/menaquinone biosynthesis C-methylase UbiE